MLTWGNTASAAAYVDGRPASYNKTSDSGKAFLPIQWNIPKPPAFFRGAFDAKGRMAWCGALDEVRIFDWPLTAADVRAEFARVRKFSVRSKILAPYLYAGTTEACRIGFDNLRAAPVTVLAESSSSQCAGSGCD